MAITPGFKKEGAAQLTEAAGLAAVGDGGTGLKRAGVRIAVEAVREVHPAIEDGYLCCLQLFHLS